MANENRTHYIYGLTDPRDGKIRYVGITINPVQRFTNHLGGRSTVWDSEKLVYPEYPEGRGCLKARWLRDLYDRGLRPGMMKLDEARDKRTALDLEKHWIEVLIIDGNVIYNDTDDRKLRKQLRQEFSTGR